MAQHNGFYFNRVSSLSRGLYVSTKMVLNSPEPILESYTVPGRAGTIYDSQGYSNVGVSYETLLLTQSPDDLQRYHVSLRNWLCRNQGTYYRLEDTYDLQHYRRAVYVSGLEPENQWRRLTRQNIEFSCEPYRYLKTGDQRVSSTGSSIELHNPTLCEALPELIIYLGMQWNGGEITLSVAYEDGTQYEGTVSGVPKSYAGTDAVVNSKAKGIYTGTDQSGYIASAELSFFPTLKPGKNTVSVSGDGLSGLGVIPHWWEL